jgi:ribosomal protein S18 acetylase RimI-like enzyme
MHSKADTTIVTSIAETDDQIASCADVLHELRPDFESAHALILQIRRQQKDGYRLMRACAENDTLGVGGYRYSENLIHGHHVYVDDLVTSSRGRRRGIGRAILDAISEEARARGCTRMVLDTGVTNSTAIGFYHRWGLSITGFHLRAEI